MSKMDRQLNSKNDKETIYEIYRACRLCGAGAGYKMPIIQNVVDLDDSDVELRQKVRDCVQIEVHQDDKMPPLICELCVDKVNDFYEFLEMCRQTNKRTRLRLGLPPQSLPRGAPDAGDCILGLTEPVYVNEDSDGEPLSKQKKTTPAAKVKREPELKVKLEKRILTDTRSSRFNKRPPTPPRVTRHRTSSKDDSDSLSRLKEKSKLPKVTPKSILKKETKIAKNDDDDSLLTPRLKRSREKELVKLDTSTKRVKIAPKSSPQTPKSSPKTSPRGAARPPPKTPKVSPKRAPSPPRVFKCTVCGQANKTPQANSNHMRAHWVGFTSLKLACNPCGLWFVTPEEAASHHRQHRNKSHPYTCRRCTADFRHLSAYDDHFEKNQCIPWDEVPDVKCDECWHLFATNKLLEDHRCLGEEHRPGGKCGKCNRSYALLRNLKKHELTCTAKKKGEVDPALLGKCKSVQIRMSRCDPLLTNLKQEHYDVSNVTADFGLDKNCFYPYISSVSSLHIKSDPDRMVAIKQEIEDEFYSEENYVHWDSDSESDEEISCSSVLNPIAKKKNVDSLANLTLKTLFSKRCLGKVPKKKRKVKQEKSMFDSLLGETEDDVTKDINNIISNLGDDDDDLDGDSQKGGENSDGIDRNSDGVKDSIVDDTDKKLDVSDDVDSNIVDGNDSNIVKDVTEDINDSSVQENDTVSQDGNDNSENDRAQSDVNLSGDVIERDDLSDQVSKPEDISTIKDFNSECNDKTSSNDNLNINDDLPRIDDKINNGINYVNDNEDISKKESDINVNDSSLDVNKDENQNDGMEVPEAGRNTPDSYSVSAVSESIQNDSTQSDVGSETEKVIDKVNINNINDNATSLPDQDIDEKSQHSELSNESQSLIDKSQNDEQKSQNNDSINENDYNNAISVIVNSGKNKNGADSEDLEDSKLMEALDAQIGEGNDNSRGVNDNFSEKIGLDDLISSKTQEIDTIPEELNFDA